MTDLHAFGIQRVIWRAHSHVIQDPSFLSNGTRLESIFSVDLSINRLSFGILKRALSNNNSNFTAVLLTHQLLPLSFFTTLTNLSIQSTHDSGNVGCRLARCNFLCELFQWYQDLCVSTWKNKAFDVFWRSRSTYSQTRLCIVSFVFCEFFILLKVRFGLILLVQDEVNAIKWDPQGLLLASCSDDLTAKVLSDSFMKSVLTFYLSCTSLSLFLY